MSERTIVSDISLPAEVAAKIEQILSRYSTRFVNGNPTDADLSGAEAMLVSSLAAEHFSRADKLKWVHTPFAGVNRLLAIPDLVNRDITITNGSGIIAASVADQVMAFVLSFSRQMAWQWAAQQKREWIFEPVRDSGTVDELAGQTMGLIGYGRIGSQIGKRAKAFDMRVIATRTAPTSEGLFLDQAYPIEQLPEVLAQSDFVVVTAPLTPQTAGLIGAAQFEQMKPSAYLINIARGQLVREAELVEALRSNRIAGAGLDVFEQEPLPAESPLWQMPNVLITPHTAGLFKKLSAASVEFFIKNMQRYLEGQSLLNVIDKQRGY